VTRKLRNDEVQIDELGDDPEELASDSAGQSGDAQGLSQTADCRKRLSVMLSGAKHLQYLLKTSKCRSFASLRMTARGAK